MAEKIAIQAADETARKEVGKRLRAARALKGLEQIELGEAADVDPSNVSRWEMGKRAISEDGLAKVARVLDVDPRWILEGVGAGPVGLPSEPNTHRKVEPSAEIADTSPSAVTAGEVEAKVRSGDLAIVPVLGTGGGQMDWCPVRAVDLKAHGLGSGSVAAVRVPDDSMYGTPTHLKRGDIVIVDTTTTAARTEALYAVDVEGVITIRRIEPQFGGGLKLVRDRDRKEQDLPPERARDLRVWGRVLYAAVKAIDG
jgi:transcriptional regulator with XRE-family HTH domain